MSVCSSKAGLSSLCATSESAVPSALICSDQTLAHSFFPTASSSSNVATPPGPAPFVCVALDQVVGTNQTRIVPWLQLMFVCPESTAGTKNGVTAAPERCNAYPDQLSLNVKLPSVTCPLVTAYE